MLGCVQCEAEPTCEQLVPETDVVPQVCVADTEPPVCEACISVHAELPAREVEVSPLLGEDRGKCESGGTSDSTAA